MAKQPHDPQKKPSKPKDEIDHLSEADLGQAPQTGASKPETTKKTMILKKAAPPTQLASGHKGPDTPPRMPKMSLADEGPKKAVDSGVAEAHPVSDVVEVQPASDIVEVEPAATVGQSGSGSDLVHAHPASDVVEVQLTSDVVEAEPAASDVVEAEAADDDEVFTAEAVQEDQVAGASAPETPVRTEHVKEQRAAPLDEDAVGGEHLATRAESSVRVRGKKPPPLQQPPLETTDAFDAADAKPEEVDQTVSFDSGNPDDSSAVDLGAHPYPKTGSSQSHAGVDEVAEALESGVKLEGADAPAKKKPDPSVEFDDLFTEEAAAEAGPPPVRGKRKEESTDPDLVLPPSGDDMPAHVLDSDSALGKTMEEDSANLWKDTGEPEAGPATPVPTTPVPARKSRIAEDEDEEEDEEEDEAAAAEAEEEDIAPPPRKKGGPPAMAPVPAQSGSGRGMLTGVLVGALVAVAAGGGAWYFDALPESPSAAPRPSAKGAPAPPPPAPTLTAAQRARGEMDEGKYAEAVQTLTDLPDAEKTPAALTTRAEARWLKYQQDQVAKKAGLSAADPEVKAVVADLDEAKNDLIKRQVLTVLAYTQLNNAYAVLLNDAKAMTNLRNMLVQSKVIDAKTDVKDLPKAISQALAGKGQTDTSLQEFQKAFVEAKIISAKDKLDPATLAKAFKDLSDKQSGLAEVNKALEDANIKEIGAKGVAELIAAKKINDDKLDAVNKALAAAKIKGDAAAGLQQIMTQQTQLAKERDELDQAIKAAYKELADGKIVAPGGDPRKDLVAAAKAARQSSDSPIAMPLHQLASALGAMTLSPVRDMKSLFDSAAAVAELNYYRMREPLIQSPEQRLDFDLALVQDRGRASAAYANSIKNATWVLSKDSGASPAARAKAQVVLGLALRNQEKFPEAKKALEAGLASPDAAGPWAAPAKQALQEMTDPAAFYLPRIDQLQSGGQIKSAQQELAVALKMMPNDARLLAQRGLMSLEEARGAGKVPADVQIGVRSDAMIAMKDPKTAAEGAYLLALLEEEAGNHAAAEKLLRQALKSHKGSADDAARYRIALARVLQRDRVPVSAPPPEENKMPEEKKAAQPKGAVGQAFPLAATFALGQAGAQDEADPATAARLKESVDLAKELIQSSNPKVQGQGHMLLGQALARQGRRTEGIREYLKGMEMLFPGMASKEMARMIEEHPAFQQADATVTAPSAYLAEVHFGKGLHLYWLRQYPEAEAHFKQATGFFASDARYQYYLGLAQYGQQSKSKRDAAFYSFGQAAKLEAANRPPVTEINASLERVQGDLRKLINSFRSKAIELRN